MGLSVEFLLSEDHPSIDRLYDEYLSEKRLNPAHALELFRKYKLTLLRHIKCEEDLIFPVLAQLPDEPCFQEVSILRDEHQSIVPLLMEVERALKERNDSSASERKLFEELHEHNAREEMRVYGPLDRLLNEGQKQAVVDALKSQRLFPKAG